MTTIAAHSARRYGLIAGCGSLLTAACLVAMWLVWIYASASDHRNAYWMIVALGTLCAVFSAASIAALNACEDRIQAWHRRWLLTLVKRVLLVSQIAASLIAAGTAAVLIFGLRIG